MDREAWTGNSFLRLGRREILAGSFMALGARQARAQSSVDLEDDLRNLRLLDLTEAGRRCVVVVPRYLAPTHKLPLAILLHGLGETGDPRLGAYAWVERYGLGSAWQRLKRAPIDRTSRRGEWTDARLSEVNAELAARPFRGFVMVCPYMPNPKGKAELDAYARWLETSLLPRVRREVAIDERPDATYLAGCSLGGWVSLEVLTRLPNLFGAWAGVQTAIGAHAAAGYADELAASWRGPHRRSMLVLTSTQDQFRGSSESLARALRGKGLDATFRVVPGPHDQPWLREAGTIETLLWLDRLSY